MSGATKKPNFAIRISSLCCDVVHELSSVWSTLLEKVLTVLKESVVVEEIKEVEVRSRRAQFIYDRNYNRIGLRQGGHARSELPVRKLRRL